MGCFPTSKTNVVIYQVDVTLVYYLVIWSFLAIQFPIYSAIQIWPNGPVRLGSKGDLVLFCLFKWHSEHSKKSDKGYHVFMTAKGDL